MPLFPPYQMQQYIFNDFEKSAANARAKLLPRRASGLATSFSPLLCQIVPTGPPYCFEN